MEGGADRLDHQEAVDICTAYQAELQRKADLLCQQKVAMNDIQTLAKDVHHLSEEVQAAWLMKKWGAHPKETKDHSRVLPEEQTSKLCNEIMEDQDLTTDIVQDLHQQQSSLDSEVAKVKSQLKGYYAES